MSLMQEIYNIVGVSPQQEISSATPIHLYPVKNRISLLGTTASGKSAHIGGLVKAAERRVSKTANTDYPFRCLILEGSTNIIDDVARLRAGHFPPKTEAYQQFASEAGLLLEWRHTMKLGPIKQTLWTKRLQVPICDLAGEDLAQVIRQVRHKGALGEMARNQVRQLISYVRQSDGYIVVIKATRAQGLGELFEPEPEVGDPKKTGLSKYPDANLVRMLYDIINYKHEHPERPIKGVSVVVTAWDGLAPVAKEIEQITGNTFDPLNLNIGQRDIEKFIYACFPSTHAAIKSLGIPNVQYFPSFFEIERNEQKQPICWEDEPNSPKIKRANIIDPDRPWEDNVNTVIDSEYWFFKELDWLQQFATLG